MTKAEIRLHQNRENRERTYQRTRDYWGMYFPFYDLFAPGAVRTSQGDKRYPFKDLRHWYQRKVERHKAHCVLFERSRDGSACQNHGF